MAKLRQFKDNPLEPFSVMRMRALCWLIGYTETKSHHKATTMQPIADLIGEDKMVIADIVNQRNRNQRVEKALHKLFLKYIKYTNDDIFKVMQYSLKITPRSKAFHKEMINKLKRLGWV